MIEMGPLFWVGGNLKIFLTFTLIREEMIQFDEHIFQVEATGTKSKLGLANLNCRLMNGPETLRVSYSSVFIFAT